MHKAAGRMDLRLHADPGIRHGVTEADQVSSAKTERIDGTRKGLALASPPATQSHYVPISGASHLRSSTGRSKSN